MRALAATALFHRTCAPTRMRCLCADGTRLAATAWDAGAGRRARDEEGTAREKSRVDMVGVGWVRARGGWGREREMKEGEEGRGRGL